jgi:nucleoside-diphosphate-sugar epimerase
MPRVLVTGASGFIAGHLIPFLREGGYEVVEVSRALGDVTDASMWAGLPAAGSVIHLAGKSFVPESWTDPRSFLNCNVLGTTAALEYCRKHSAHFVYLSSYMYGNPESLPIPESAPVRVNNPYALSKKLAEDVSRFYADGYGLDVSILRLFNVYGPGQGVKFLVPFVVQQAMTSDRIHVKDLEPKRDYVYVTDVVRAIFEALRARPRGYGLYNIGSGSSYSVAQLIDSVQDTWRTDLPVSSDAERRVDEIMDTVADISEAGRRLGWKPQFSLEAGLRDMHRREQAVASHPVRR